MKHLKTYEQIYKKSLIDKPKVGDYAIISFGRKQAGQHIEFMENNICKIERIYQDSGVRNYKIVFDENIPGFDIKSWIIQDIKYIGRSYGIILFSSDKEEIEAYLSANKYNI